MRYIILQVPMHVADTYVRCQQITIKAGIRFLSRYFMQADRLTQKPNDKIIV